MPQRHLLEQDCALNTFPQGVLSVGLSQSLCPYTHQLHPEKQLQESAETAAGHPISSLGEPIETECVDSATLHASSMSTANHGLPEFVMALLDDSTCCPLQFLKCRTLSRQEFCAGRMDYVRRYTRASSNTLMSSSGSSATSCAPADCSSSLDPKPHSTPIALVPTLTPASMS